MEYEINRGVGREVEFRGLTARYLFLFAGGLLGTFLLVVVLYLAGTAQSICLGSVSSRQRRSSPERFVSIGNTDAGD